MIGMEHVIETRRRGLKPAAVIVNVVAEPDRERCFRDPWGVHHVEVASGESLSSLDLRPFVGLWVVVFGDGGEFHHKLARRLAEINPSKLCMPFPLPDGSWRVHVKDDRGSTTHTVTGDDAESLAKGVSCPT